MIYSAPGETGQHDFLSQRQCVLKRTLCKIIIYASVIYLTPLSCDGVRREEGRR